MKKLAGILLIITCLQFFACSTKQNNHDAKLVSDKQQQGKISYFKAVEEMGAYFSDLILDDEIIFIENIIVSSGGENLLSRRFVEDLSIELIQNKVDVRRRKPVSWVKTPDLLEFNRVPCSGNTENMSPDLVLEFKLLESMTPGHLDARATLVRTHNDKLEGSESKSFILDDHLKGLYEKKAPDLQPYGEMKNPYISPRQAANYMVGKIACNINSMFSEIDQLQFVVAITGETPPEIASVFVDAVSEYNLKQASYHEDWLVVTINSSDRFEQDLYRKTKRELYGIANVVLGIDVSEQSKGVLLLRTAVLTLNDLETDSPNRKRSIDAGSIVPRGIANGYVLFDRKLPVVTKSVVAEIEKKSTIRGDSDDPEWQEYLRQNNKKLVEIVNDIAKDRLREDLFGGRVVNSLKITGKIETRNCRTDSRRHIASNRFSPRRYSDAKYDLKLVLGNNEILEAKGIVKGVGSNCESAKEQALLGIIHELYPDIFILAGVLHQDHQLDKLRTLLNHLLRSGAWTYVKGINVDKVFRQIAAIKSTNH